MSYVLIIGAKSDIAKSLARVYASHGYDLYLAARKTEELDELIKDIKVRYDRTAIPVELDVTDTSSHTKVYASLNPFPDGVISVAGYLGSQQTAQIDFGEADRIMRTNYTGLVSLLNIAANSMEQKKSGFIIGISSVAGDRGRKKNYIYGSAKAGFTEYLSGLRNRLFESNVHVMTVKPGFVDTHMTENMELPKRLTAQPDEVAEDIYRSWTKKKNVIYTKRIWGIIMLVIKHIPEFMFKKTDI